jgi:hypothetical protein
MHQFISPCGMLDSQVELIRADTVNSVYMWPYLTS